MKVTFSPPARWGLLDFMSVASSSPPLLSSSSCSTATLDAQCSLSDLNHDHPRPAFPAGPQPRPSPPSVPCRTSTTTIHAQCSLPDLNREYPRQVFPAGPHVGRYGTKNVQKKVRKNVRQVCYILLANSRTCQLDLNGQIECQKICQMEYRMPEDMPDKMPWDMPDRMPDRMPEDMPDRMPDRMPEDMSEYLPEHKPEDMPDRMPEHVSEYMPEDMPDRLPEDVTDRMPEDMPDRMPEDLPEDLPDRMPEDMPEDLLDRMPDRMLEHMSEYMPEDLPVRKSINVMVGITRSKVILIFLHSWRNLRLRWISCPLQFMHSHQNSIKQVWASVCVCVCLSVCLSVCLNAFLDTSSGDEWWLLGGDTKGNS